MQSENEAQQSKLCKNHQRVERTSFLQAFQGLSTVYDYENLLLLKCPVSWSWHIDHKHFITSGDDIAGTKVQFVVALVTLKVTFRFYVLGSSHVTTPEINKQRSQNKPKPSKLMSWRKHLSNLMQFGSMANAHFQFKGLSSNSYMTLNLRKLLCNFKSRHAASFRLYTAALFSLPLLGFILSWRFCFCVFPNHRSWLPNYEKPVLLPEKFVSLSLLLSLRPFWLCKFSATSTKHKNLQSSGSKVPFFWLLWPTSFVCVPLTTCSLCKWYILLHLF